MTGAGDGSVKHAAYGFWLRTALLLMLLWPAATGFWVLNSTVSGYRVESLAAVTVAVTLVLAGLPFRRMLVPVDRRVLAGICAILSAFAISATFAAIHPDWALVHGAADITLAIGALGALAAIRAYGDRLVRDVLNILILSMLLYLAFYVWFFPELVERAEGKAVYSFFPFVNVRRFTNVLAPIVAVALAMWAVRPDRGDRFGAFYLVAATVFATTVIWTGGRAPVLAIGGAMLLISALSQGHVRWRMLGGAVFAFVAGSVASLWLPRPDGNFSLWARAVAPEKLDTVAAFSSNRVWIWQETARLITERPLFGYGYKQWTFQKPEFVYHGSAHNFPLQIVFDLGLVGGGAALLLVFGFWVTRLKQLKEGNPLFVAAVAGLSVMVLQSFVDGIFSGRASLQMVFLFFALAAASGSARDGNG